MPSLVLPASLTGPRARGALLMALGLVAIFAPLVAGEWALSLIGVAVAVLGVGVIIRTLRATDSALGVAAYASGGASVLIGLLMFLHPVFVLNGLLTLIAVVLAADGAGKLAAAVRGRSRHTVGSLTIFSGLVDLLLALIIWRQRSIFGVRALGLLVGIRIFSAGWSLLLAPARERDAEGREVLGDSHPDQALGPPALSSRHPRRTCRRHGCSRHRHG